MKIFEVRKVTWALLGLLLTFSTLGSANSRERIDFADVSSLLASHQSASLPMPAAGEGLTGVAWLDFDADGNLDLYGIFLTHAQHTFMY